MNKTSNIIIALTPLWVVSFVSNLAPYIYIPSFPDIASAYSITQSKTASLMSVYYFTMSMTLLAVGMVGNVWSKKRLLIYASALMVAGALIAGSINSFNTMLLGWAMQAVGVAVVVVIGQTWIGQSSNKDNVTLLYSCLTVVMSLAPLIASILGGAVSELFSWQYNFFFVATLSLIAMALVGKSTPPAPVKRVFTAREIAASYLQILFDAKFIGLIAVTLACFIFQGALTSYSSFLFIGQLGVKPSFYGLISIPAVGGIMLGQLPVVYIERKKGVVAAYLFNSAIILIALLFSIGYYLLSETHSVTELAIVIFVFNIGFGGHILLSIRNVMTAFASSGSHASALVNFLYQFTGYLASLLVQLLLALVTSTMQVHNLVAVLATILIVVSIPAGLRSLRVAKGSLKNALWKGK